MCNSTQTSSGIGCTDIPCQQSTVFSPTETPPLHNAWYRPTRRCRPSRRRPPSSIRCCFVHIRVFVLTFRGHTSPISTTYLRFTSTPNSFQCGDHHGRHSRHPQPVGPSRRHRASRRPRGSSPNWQSVIHSSDGFCGPAGDAVRTVSRSNCAS